MERDGSGVAGGCRWQPDHPHGIEALSDQQDELEDKDNTLEVGLGELGVDSISKVTSMRAVSWIAIILVAAVAAATVWSQVPQSSSAEPYRAPRTAAGAPDLNGIWQALNTANFDIEAHTARPALAIIPASPRTGAPGLARATHVDLPAPSVRALGAVGGVPAGAGVVEGNEIPYQPWAVAKKKENADKWLERDPEIKCFMPGVPR